MSYSFIIIAWVIVLFSTAFLYRKWAAYCEFQAATTQYSCQRPPKYPHRERIWGTDLNRKRREAVQNGRLMELYMNHFNLYGKTWEETFYGTKVINTMELRNIQHVAALGNQDYCKSTSASATKASKAFLGEGIFVQDGIKWKQSRDLIRPIFSRSELSDIDSLEVHVDRFLDVIPGDGSTVDLQDPLHRLFLDVSTDFLFGESMNSQLPNDPNNSTEFIKAWNESLLGVGRRRLWGKLQSLVFIFDKTWGKAYRKVHSRIDMYVQRALYETKDEKDLDNKPQTRYVLLYEIAKQIRDPIILRSQILNVFLPARDSVSIFVGNALFHLARNPEIWTRLREESLALSNQPLTFELLKSLQFFKHVLNETIRLQGPSGRTTRTAVRNTTLPLGGGPDGKSPVFVKQGDMIAINIWGLHHDKDIWGDDVNEFKPDRWIGRRSLWEFVPFLGGPRICPANQQVFTQATYLLVKMTKSFTRIENRDEVNDYVERIKMTTESRNGIKVALFST